MARKLRIEYEGAVYHLMSRGNGEQEIFRDDQDRTMFIKALGEVCEKTGWRVHAFCLMGNHFHLCIETPQPNLVIGMKWLLGTYSARFNKRHKQVGHLFAGRYKSLIVDPGDGDYLQRVCDYIHLNPIRAQLLTPDQVLKDYPWSSYPLYLLSPTQRPTWLEPKVLLKETGLQADHASSRQIFERRMEKRKQQDYGDTQASYTSIRSGWFFGEDQLRQELLTKLEAMEGKRVSHSGVILKESQQIKARHLLETLLRKEDLSSTDLEQMRKGDPAKIRMASVLRQRTTMSLKWIAEHLKMGTWTYVSNLLSQERQQKPSLVETDPKRS